MYTKITHDEYVARYIPFGAYVLIKKDLLPEKTASGIHLVEQGRQKEGKWGMTGVIMAKSPCRTFEKDYDGYLMNLLKNGDRVGFNAANPITSPSPPLLQFSTEKGDMMYAPDMVTIHVFDLLCIYHDTNEAALATMESRDW